MSILDRDPGTWWPFTERDEKASITTLEIEFQRTLRIPDDGKTYPLPAGFGAFPLRHVDDYKDTVPTAWIERGGVLMPMYQSEALWINFSTRYPFAVKVAAGKINAVTGELWQTDLQPDPQNYLVLPEQPWLDGFAVRKGVIRQFVAMPLGAGYSAEEQITGKADMGGIQLQVFPLRAEAYFRTQVAEHLQSRSRICLMNSWTRNCSTPAFNFRGVLVRACAWRMQRWGLVLAEQCVRRSSKILTISRTGICR